MNLLQFLNHPHRLMPEPLPWWRTATIYELYVDKFAGDFRGLIGRLGYLKELGVDCIWLLPHYPSPMSDDGYDISDYTAVRKELGTLDDFDAFIAAAHDHGIRVIADLVLNHTSTRHPWFLSALAEPTGRFRDFYLWSGTGTELADAVNPFEHLKPSNWIPTGSGDFHFSTFLPEQADLNWDNPAVMEEFRRIMSFWLDHGVDGFRLDAVTHLIKREGTRCTNLPETHDVVRRLREFMDGKAPDAVLLGEANGTPRDIRDYFGHGDECHMLFNFPLTAMIYLGMARGDDTLVYEHEHEWNNIPPGCGWAMLLRNHDELSLKYATRAVHDEVMDFVDPDHRYSLKRDLGTAVRLATILRGDWNRIESAFRLLFSLDGTPIIYMGDELGMMNTATTGADIRRSARAPIDWQDAQRQREDPDSLFRRVAAIIRERRERLTS